uniref:UNC93-like protein MFSD11 n=1 Tax=Ditylenchus dipsaci TaxID=166011 RepID=A0A915D134_9BILA
MNSFTLNVVQLAIGFFLIFFAYFSQSFIEESVIDSYAHKGVVDKHDGYTSLAIIFASLTVSTFLAAPIVGVLNPKWAMVFGASTYVIFQLGFLFLNKAFLFGSSAFVGLGAAVIWTAQGSYIALNSTEETANKHVSLFWSVSQSCFAFGGVFLYFVFRHTDSFGEHTVHTIYSVFTAVTILGAVVLALLRMPVYPPGMQLTDGKIIPKEVPLTHMQMFASTIKLARKQRMLVLSVGLLYTGLQLSFWSGIYPTCISFTQKLGTNTKTLLAMSTIMQGFGEATSGIVFGLLGTSNAYRPSRIQIVCFGTFAHLVAYIAVFVNFPTFAPLTSTNENALIEPRYIQ